MTTRLSVLLIAMVLVSGCKTGRDLGSDESDIYLEEIVLDHRCPKQKIKDIELKSLRHARLNKIKITWFAQSYSKVTVRIDYPKKVKDLPIESIYLSQSNNRLILNDRNSSSELGLAFFTLSRSEVLKSKLNLDYYHHNFCTSVVSYSFNMSKAFESES